MLLIMVVSLAVPGIHLLLKTPEAGNDALDPRNYGIKITCISSSARVFADGRQIIACGSPGATRQPPSRFEIL